MDSNGLVEFVGVPEKPVKCSLVTRHNHPRRLLYCTMKGSIGW